MKILLGFLRNRWLHSSFGLLGLAVAIWLLGPQIAFGNIRPLESESARLVTILVIIVVWALNQLRKVLKANKANKAMVEGLVDTSAAAPDQSQEEVNALKQRFEQAVAVLKKAKGKKGRLSLYDLPWYIIIGPPGSGKTTALVNSGLEFPLAEQFGREALSGVGGTRNCDWWFTDEAILLDTAGRYTTQDSDASVDRSAWEGFLALLKKYRKRRPINGVIVAISLLDLMTLSEHERIAHARAIKGRIQELDEYFKIRFPVYVLLTKCDLVAGFMEFFDDLNRNEREQVWGATFPIEVSDSPQGAVERFGPEFDALLERLSSRLLWRLSQERDPRRRAAIYGFPRQLATLKDNVASFLNDVFRGSRFEQAPMLRGVYFTSGTQEGTPIDRLMGMIARTFGVDSQVLPAQGGRGRSYFLKSLLNDVVFRESEVAGTNRRFEAQRAWLQRAAYAGSVLLALLLIVGWSVSYLNNRSMIAEVEAATTKAADELALISPTETDVLTLLPALEAVRAIPAVYEGSADAPWLQGLGLNQGRKLRTRSEVAYRQVLREFLLPRLIVRTEGHLRAGGATQDFQYEALKAYLMLDSRDHYDGEAVIGWFGYDYDQYIAPRADTAARDAFLGHLTALFREQPEPLPVALDQNLIEQTQRVVARMPTEERIYSRLKRSGAAASLPEFTLFTAAGARAPLVFTRRSGSEPGAGIDGFFTREGYRQSFVSQSAEQAGVLIDESWILGPYAPTDLDRATVLARVKNLYLEEFVREYEIFLNDIALAGFATPEEAATVLNILSEPAGSPLVLLLRAVAEQTQLEPPASEGTAASIGARARDTVQRLEGLLGGGESQPAAAAASTTNVVDERFRWVRELVGTGDAAAPIASAVALLNQLYEFMSTVVAQRGVQGDVPTAVADAGRAIIQSVRTQATRQPGMVRTLLEDAATRSQRLVFDGVRAHLNAQWQSDALSFCRRAIEGRYPIAPASAEEIDLADFGRFFAPGGIADSYFREYLAEYVDTTRSPWRPRASGAAPVQVSQAALQQFERAAAIRDAFFRAGGTLPSVSFELTPVGMDESITQFTLDLGGQRVTYSHGPVRPQRLEWPAPSGSGEVRIEMAPPVAGDNAMLRESSPWAWFKVLRGVAEMRNTDRADVFEVEFKLGSRTALYRLSARSADNPFSSQALAQFRCPEAL